MNKIDYKQYIPRLKELSKHHLNCSLDDNEPGYIPDDLEEGTYRWFVYLYSNLFKPNEDTITFDDKQMFLALSTKFKTEHLINWTRDTLIAYDKNFVSAIRMCAIENLNKTYSFYELRVNIYTLRCLSVGWYYTDSYILNISKDLRRYIHE